MKIEMLESLGCSYLRHVRKCWIVQSNWKASDMWSKQKSTDQLDVLFQDMKSRFDGDGNEVFKGTKSVDQFLKQAEVDILGVDFNGDVHALEVAFHEAGLNYVGQGGTRARILKKLLRTYLMLQAFDGFGGRAHVCFISPKVNPATASALDEVFGMLRHGYPDIDWYLYMNESFGAEILQRTLEATAATSDTSELFVRAARLIDTGATARKGVARRSEPKRDGPHPVATEQLQSHVRRIMRTLLEEHPALLDEGRRRSLLDPDFCKRSIGLKIGNLPLLRHKGDGRELSGRSRYWAASYADSYYVCSQWWAADHSHNARSLLAYLMQLRQTAPDGPDREALDRHAATMSAYIERNWGAGALK